MSIVKPTGADRESIFFPCDSHPRLKIFLKALKNLKMLEHCRNARQALG
jgi:hypothetical protein